MLLKKLSSLCINRYITPQLSLLYLHSKCAPMPLIYYKFLSKKSLSTRSYHEDVNNHIFDDPLEMYGHEAPLPVRFTLFQNCDDPLINQLNKSVSIQETLDIVDKYSKILDYKHLTQAVLVLWDLQQVYVHINKLSNVDQIDNLLKGYVSQLTNRDEFKKLLDLITINASEFEFDALCSTILYLNKVGVPLQDPSLTAVMHNISEKLKQGEFSLKGVSKYLVTVCSNYSQPYSFYKDVFPQVYKSIDKCKTPEDLRLLTICLSAMSNVLQKETKASYDKKVEEFLSDENLIKGKYQVILKVIRFLSYPLWRHENVALINKCMVQITDDLNNLSIYELVLLFEVFSKSSEPAEILTQLQRSAYKYFHNLEEITNDQMKLKIRLLVCILKYSSVEQKARLKNIINNLLIRPVNSQNLLELNKLMLSTKNYDFHTSAIYWSNLLDVMEHDEDFKNKNILLICYNYLNCYMSINHRNFFFEKRINQWLEGEIEKGFTNIIPRRFSMLASFVIAFGTDVSIINHIVNKLKTDWHQLQYVDCLNLSKGLKVGCLVNKRLNERYINSINHVVNNSITHQIEKGVKANEISALVKSYINRNEYDEKQIVNLLNLFKELKDNVNSMYIKNITFALSYLNILIPSLLESMVKFVIDNKNYILAWNAERVAFLCYYLGYSPENKDLFLKNLVDVMVRDRERLGGISFIKCCIALCYFNSPSALFVKHIFNTEFLEKLEVEFSNYSSKDGYPGFVRHKLMELNRMVCIDFPELQIPWFHQKYLKDFSPKEVKIDEWDSLQIRECLNKLYRYGKISSDVLTPYGYFVDYVVEVADSTTPKKLAVIVLKPNAFTKVNVQLLGSMQLKIRHLEILGYEVLLLDLMKFKSFIYGEEKVCYLKRIWSKSDKRLQNVNS